MQSWLPKVYKVNFCCWTDNFLCGYIGNLEKEKTCIYKTLFQCPLWIHIFWFEVQQQKLKYISFGSFKLFLIILQKYKKFRLEITKNYIFHRVFISKLTKVPNFCKRSWSTSSKTLPIKTLDINFIKNWQEM